MKSVQCKIRPGCIQDFFVELCHFTRFFVELGHFTRFFVDLGKYT